MLKIYMEESYKWNSEHNKLKRVKAIYFDASPFGSTGITVKMNPHKALLQQKTICKVKAHPSPYPNFIRYKYFPKLYEDN